MSFPIVNNALFLSPNNVPYGPSTSAGRNASKFPGIPDKSPLYTKKVIKRKFPGPAGLLPDEKLSVELEESSLKRLKDDNPRESSEDIICSQRSASIYEEGPWIEMLRDFQNLWPNDTPLPDKYNIKWIKANAFSKKLISQKVPFLAAIVQSIDANSTLTSINLTLKDMTGEIEAAILSSLYQEYADDLTPGSVIVLKQFGVFTTGNSRFYLTITPNNLITIYTRNSSNDTTHLNMKDYLTTERSPCSVDSNADIPQDQSQSFLNQAVKKVMVQIISNEDVLNRPCNNVVDQASLKRFFNQSIGEVNQINFQENCNNRTVNNNSNLFGKGGQGYSVENHKQQSSSSSYNKDIVCSRTTVASTKTLTGSSFRTNLPISSFPTGSNINNNKDSNVFNKPEPCSSATSKKNATVGSKANMPASRTIPSSSQSSSSYVGSQTLPKSIFDTDIDDLSLCFEEDFEPDNNERDQTKSPKSKIDFEPDSNERDQTKSPESKIDNQFSSYKGSNKLVTCESVKEIENVPNISVAIKERSNTKQNVTAASTIKNRIAQFKFIPKTCDADNENKNGSSSGTEEKLEQGKENVYCENVNSGDIRGNMVISSSQLSVKTTNVEHNQIWRNVLDDLDTDSLFEDF